MRNTSDSVRRQNKFKNSSKRRGKEWNRGKLKEMIADKFLELKPQI